MNQIGGSSKVEERMQIENGKRSELVVSSEVR